MTEENFVPPKAPKNLCFGELDFVQKNFDVDEFLHNHRKNVSLEKMRDDLGLYLKTLRSAMIELINKDYADFVNLSSNLIGLDTAIENLEAPLGQLREEILQVRQTLEDAIEEITTTLEKRHQIREHKRSLHSLIRIHKSIVKLSSILLIESEDHQSCTEPDILERAATEFNQLKFNLSRCKTEMSQDQHAKIVELDEVLKSNLSKLLVKNIQSKDATGLVRCLRIYVTLDKVSDAEDIVKLKIVKPTVEKLIDEKVLQSEPLELQGVYGKLENVLDEDLKELLHVTVYHERTLVEGFNFLVNSFWPEVENQLETNLFLIFAPGNPDLFHRRYSETLKFLIKLEKKCAKPEIVYSLKEHPQYKQFLKKWNLPVYFQIRFQEIAGSAESVLYEDPSLSSMVKDRQTVDSKEFSLYATKMIWDCLLRTWSNDVFLVQLLHRFWKLSLQLLSRYCEWSMNALKTKWNVTMENETEVEFDSSRLEFFVCLYTDIEKLIAKLPALLTMVTKKMPVLNKKIADSLNDSLKVSRMNLEENCLPKINDEIVNELLNQSAQHLKQISDIPRLFRRTNREIPTKPCAYVKNALSGLLNFHAKYKQIIPINLERWLTLTICSLTKRYLSAVNDVLTSVQKTEESLKRLKKIRDKSTGATSSEGSGVSDDDKIRMQLAIDVASYARIVNDLGIEEASVTDLSELKQLVESAVKNKIEFK